MKPVWEKEIYRMQPDRNVLGREALEYVRNQVSDSFGKEMELRQERSNWDHHGWFMLVFHYVPKKYTVYFEREFHSFNIRITNEDGGYIALEQIVDYENRITGEAVRSVVKRLKTALEGDISFYKIINGKRYRQKNGTYQKIEKL